MHFINFFRIMIYSQQNNTKGPDLCPPGFHYIYEPLPLHLVENKRESTMGWEILNVEFEKELDIAVRWNGWTWPQSYLQEGSCWKNITRNRRQNVPRVRNAISVKKLLFDWHLRKEWINSSTLNFHPHFSIVQECIPLSWLNDKPCVVNLEKWLNQIID